MLFNLFASSVNMQVDIIFPLCKFIMTKGKWMFSTGHYVVISGYDATTDEFEIRDPASSRY